MLRLFLTLSLALAATPALAHLDPGQHGSFLAGLSHPIFGLDHVLAMIAVGLWGAVLGGAARWALPTAFVVSMVAGFLLALAGLPVPLVEPVILASVLVLGLAVALLLRLPLPVAVAVTGLFGLFHGHAHGGELGEAGAAAFGLGFAASTAVLHAAGLLIAAGYAPRGGRGPLVRALGLATALGGLWIAAGG
jgi:urease accessory protein